jgi:hypothetical protein
MRPGREDLSARLVRREPLSPVDFFEKLLLALTPLQVFSRPDRFQGQEVLEHPAEVTIENIRKVLGQTDDFSNPVIFC